MKASQDFMKDNGMTDRISFADGSSHTVKLIKDKIDSIPDGKGGQIKGMKYQVEEDGVIKTIFTGSIGLVSKLAKCEEGNIVTIKMGKANNKSFYTVNKVDADGKGEEIKDETAATTEAEDIATDKAADSSDVEW